MERNVLEMSNKERELIEAVNDGNCSILDFYSQLGETRGNLVIAMYQTEERTRVHERN